MFNLPEGRKVGKRKPEAGHGFALGEKTELTRQSTIRSVHRTGGKDKLSEGGRENTPETARTGKGVKTIMAKQMILTEVVHL